MDPISVPYRGYRLHELPPNGQGIAALEILRLLEPFDLKAMGHNSVPYLHHLIEAKKLAYADLEHFVGDPAGMKVAPDDLLSDEFIAARRALLDPRRAIERADPGSAITAGASETTYFTVADRHGNMVSFINSIASAFGSGVVVPGTGFALQNRGVGFSLDADRANVVAPGRRPFHTIIPAFVTKTAADGREEPWLSYGVMGGAMQPQGHVQVLINLVDFGMDLQQAPRRGALQPPGRQPCGHRARDSRRGAAAAGGHGARAGRPGRRFLRRRPGDHEAGAGLGGRLRAAHGRHGCGALRG